MVRTYTTENEVWFNLSDICKSLGVKNPRDVKRRVDEDNLISLNLKELQNTVDLTDGINQTNGPGNPNSTFVNESGLYEVILRSDSPKAKPFRKWVTSEVLPSIRK